MKPILIVRCGVRSCPICRGDDERSGPLEALAVMLGVSLTLWALIWFTARWAWALMAGGE